MKGMLLRSFRLAVAVLIPLFLVVSCASPSRTAIPSAGSPGEATCSYPAGGTAAKPATAPLSLEPNTGSIILTLSLTGGDVQITMDRSKTPCTVGSFVHLAEQGYFNNTPCHRLTASDTLKVLQCGDPAGTGLGGPGYSFADELDGAMTYPAGTVAMANSGPNTNGSQFFMVYGDSVLEPAYTVFGKVTGGLDVLTKIAAAGISGGGQDGSPATPITITKVAVGS